MVSMAPKQNNAAKIHCSSLKTPILSLRYMVIMNFTNFTKFHVFGVHERFIVSSSRNFTKFHVFNFQSFWGGRHPNFMKMEDFWRKTPQISWKNMKKHEKTWNFMKKLKKTWNFMKFH
jgi:hypothetical protein